MTTIYHIAALAYAARGWAVFPLRVRDKRPMIEPSAPGANDGGFHAATTDAAQIEAWWTRWPNANIGMATGAASGVFVLDLDGPEAEAGLARLAGGPHMAPTLMQYTGKGRHLLFKHVEGVRNRGGGYLVDGKRVKCAGFDVRGDGGYIVLPPSIHPSGRQYAWADRDTPIANAPDWLLRAIVPPPPKPAAAAASYSDRFRGGRATAYGEKALDSACRRIATAAPGVQNTTLTSEAAAIGELVAGGEIEAAYAERALRDAAAQMSEAKGPWLAQQIEAKIAWGFSVGQSRPRKVTREDRLGGPQSETRAERFERGVRQASLRDDRGPVAVMMKYPPAADATLIVADRGTAELAALAWEDAQGGAYGLFVVRDLGALAGGIAKNRGGFDDWSRPSPDPERPAATSPWRGRVLVVLPGALEGFHVSKGTKWEKWISAARLTQVIALCVTHWWKAAGASDVQVATLPADEAEGQREAV
ncbi:MAG TPA: bifunctional DNA primase/polymerase [Vitreimonas sp.]|uniref:bifunctional DNA primase/polymerase n=1 Tax=Vitreimonas sp. TaxID=3069702 RepID=UPI002D5EF3FA|nr:bifunctional DNA primase/polymerase [Vitreimonas sp.]HYD87133.1 bifunctional DNA primase/polymerase [Vitreimonas sp.]